LFTDLFPAFYRCTLKSLCRSLEGGNPAALRCPNEQSGFIVNKRKKEKKVLELFFQPLYTGLMKIWIAQVDYITFGSVD
jgi:hypothetical protein